jgi:signal transduction histidine kinase
MLLNLMDNARKYSGKSKLIRVNLWVQDKEVVIEVQDHGLGIPADEIDKIFQPFYRAVKGNEKGGCGLGLYLVDQVMKEHGGRVEVDSEVDSGSRFRLLFPISDSPKKGIAKQKKRSITSQARSEPQVQDPS